MSPTAGTKFKVTEDSKDVLQCKKKKLKKSIRQALEKQNQATVVLDILTAH